MQDVRPISDVITDIFELLDRKFSHARVARGVKLAVNDLNIYSKSQIGFVSDLVIVGSNLTADLPNDCGGVTKVAKVSNGIPYLLDRDLVVLNKERYQLKQNEKKLCENCTCGASTCGDADYVPTTLPTAAQMQGTNLCPYSTFYNPLFTNCSCIGSTYRPNYGNYQIEDSRIVFSGVYVGDEILIEYKKMTNASNYQLIPKAAFDVIFHKAQTYFDSMNTNHEILYRKAKVRFDGLKERENYTLDGIVRILRRY